MDSTDETVDVFYPLSSSAPSARKFPLISYAHGFSGGGDVAILMYYPLLYEIASYGFIVAATRACNFGCVQDKVDLKNDPPGFGHYYKQLLKVIQFAREASLGGDAVFSQANFSVGVGVAGHSMGGQASLFASSFANASSADIRAAVMHHAYTHEHPPPQVPFLAFTGEKDWIAPPKMTTAFFDAPGGCGGCSKGLVDKISADHMQPCTEFFKVAFYTAGWFKLHLERRSWDLEIDWDDAIFGNSSTSLCGGGDGDMKRCELVRAT